MSRLNTCQLTRSRPALGDQPSLAQREVRGNHPPIFQIPASPAAAQRAHSAAEGRARVRSGATGGAGLLIPVPRSHPLPTILSEVPLAEQRGGRPRRSPDSAGRRTASRFFSGHLGVPHGIFTLHFAKSWIFPLATNWPGFSGKAQFEHPQGYSRTTRETAVGAHSTRLRERRHTLTHQLRVLSG